MANTFGLRADSILRAKILTCRGCRRKRDHVVVVAVAVVAMVLVLDVAARRLALIEQLLASHLAGKGEE